MIQLTMKQIRTIWFAVVVIALLVDIVVITSNPTETSQDEPLCYAYGYPNDEEARTFDKIIYTIPCNGEQP